MKRFQTPVIALLTLVFIILIITNISLPTVLKSLLSIGWGTIFLCLLLHFCVYLFRCLAMNVFLSKEVPFHYLLATHLIHNFYLNILPVNMGELSLPLMLSKFVSKTRSFSVLLITRIITVLVMALLFIISTVYIFHGLEQIDFNLKRIAVIVTGAVVFSLAVIMLWSNGLFKHKIIELVKKKLIKLKDSMVFSFRIEMTVPRIAFLVTVTLAYMTFMALFFQLILSQLNISISLIEMFFIMSLQMAILILPIKSFGGIGTTEGVWMAGMMSLGIGSKVALESGVIMHIIQLFSATVFFLIGLAAKYAADRKAV
jgi:uncharacterized membrane protein YbhN (UPF0104 family)